MTGEFDPQQYRDEYREALMQVIESKVEGRETVSLPEPEEGTKLVDLMAALQASVKAASEARAAKSEKPESVEEARTRRAAGSTSKAKAASAADGEADQPAERPARKRKSA
jgi:DNA end-binding protein Ku